MTATPQSARFSVSLIFLIYGTLIGSYLPYLPFVKDRFGIGESAFSMGFLFGAEWRAAVLAAGAVDHQASRHPPGRPAHVPVLYLEHGGFPDRSAVLSRLSGCCSCWSA